jgi:hypothetical protein
MHPNRANEKDLNDVLSGIHSAMLQIKKACNQPNNLALRHRSGDQTMVHIHWRWGVKFRPKSLSQYILSSDNSFSCYRSGSTSVGAAPLILWTNKSCQ